MRREATPQHVATTGRRSRRRSESGGRRSSSSCSSTTTSSSGDGGGGRRMRRRSRLEGGRMRVDVDAANRKWNLYYDECVANKEPKSVAKRTVSFDSHIQVAYFQKNEPNSMRSIRSRRRRRRSTSANHHHPHVNRRRRTISLRSSIFLYFGLLLLSFVIDYRHFVLILVCFCVSVVLLCPIDKQ